MNKDFKMNLGIFIFILLLAAFFVFSSISEFLINLGFLLFFFDFCIGLSLLVSFITTKGLARLPERTIGARVIAKNIKKELSDGEGGRDNYYYMVTFQSENNDIWSFPLSVEIYNVLLPEDYGTLIYKINKKGKVFFFSFTRR